MKKTCTLLLAIIFSCLVCHSIKAQSSANYTASAGSHESLTPMNVTNVLIGPGEVMAASSVTEIGFEFWFMGKRYTTFSVSTNGILRFGNVPVNGNANTPALPGGQQRICAIASGDGNDFNCMQGSDGDWRTLNSIGMVHYRVTGNAPDRVLTVEWKDMEMEAGTGTPDGTFQIRIHETASNNANGGRMELVYGNMKFPAVETFCSSDNSQTAVRAGFGMSSLNNQFAAIDLQQHPETGPNAISRQVALQAFYPASLLPINLSSDHDGQRKFYNFVSVAPDGQVVNLTASCISSYGAGLEWSSTGRNEVGYAIYLSRDGVNYTFYNQFARGTTSHMLTGLDPGTTYHVRAYTVTEGKMAALDPTGQVTFTTPHNLFTSVKSGLWTDPSVWAGGRVPTMRDDVLIGCTTPHTVTVNASARACRNLTIQNSSSLVFSRGQSLVIYGDLTNHGTFNLTRGSAHLAGHLTNNGTWIADYECNFTFNGSQTQNILNNTGNSTLFRTATGRVEIADNTPWGGFSPGVAPSAPALTSCRSCAMMEVEVPQGDYPAQAFSDIRFTIRHTRAEDLDIYLVAPDGNKVWLISDDNGSTADNYENTEIRDGNMIIAGGWPPFTGAFSAEDASSFASYPGPYHGTWKLYAIDDTWNGEAGQITEFRVGVKLAAPAINFYNLSVHNTGQTGIVQGNSDLVVINNLSLDDGVLYTGKFKTIFNDNSTVGSFRSDSFIEGWVRKIGDDAFTFPLGRNGIKGTLRISAPQHTGDHFTATYLRGSAADAGYPVAQKAAGIYNVSTCEYWILDRTAGRAQVSVALRYDDLLSCGVAVPAALLVCRWDGSQWQNHGNSSTTGGMVTSVGTISSFSPFTLGSNSAVNILPVHWLSFKASKKEQHVLLEWQTAGEKNNDHFVVERSADGKTFLEAGRVKAGTPGQGKQQYQFEDRPASAAGVLYYRIKQYDTDGSFSYSDVRSITFETPRFTLLRAYPNPFAEDFTVEYSIPQDGKVHFELIDALGKTVYEAHTKAHQGVNRFSPQPGLLPQGMYVLKVQYDGVILKQKITK